MRHEEAIAGLSYLVATTPGWTDEAVEVYVKEAKTYHDPDAFARGCKNLALHWSKPHRPYMFDINVAYQAELRNQEMNRTLSAESQGVVIPPSEGIKIAWEAYQDECRRLGKAPNRAIFEKWLPAP